MNVYNVWDMGYNGSGIVIAIVDDGIDTNHSDITFVRTTPFSPGDNSLNLHECSPLLLAKTIINYIVN